MPRNKNEVVVISWRDIPAQINGQQGAERHQVVLAHRFQKAIDRAAMIADKKTAQEYVGEWRRVSHPLAGELVSTVEATAATIDTEFTTERLHALVANGGWDPANPRPSVDPSTDTSIDLATEAGSTGAHEIQETP